MRHESNHITPVLPVSEGVIRLSEIIESFAKEVKAYTSSSDSKAPQLAIKATAGLGKTTQIIEKLISRSALKNGDVHYYVPNHRLSTELTNDLSEELDFDFSQGQGHIFSRVKTVAGRSQKDKQGNTLCQKSKLAESTAEAGLSISKTLCKNKDNLCEFYNSCGYQNQFMSEEKIAEWKSQWPEGFPTELLNDVTVMTHANLFLQTNKRLPKPSLIVVDEAFYQQGIYEEKVNSIELYKGKHPISNVILSHLTDGESNLLAKLREHGYSVKDLLNEAHLIEGAHNEDNQSAPLLPSFPSNKQQLIIEDIVTKKRASLILKSVAQEMTITERDECHSVSYDDENDQVLIHQRNELTIPEDVPTVFIDADAQKVILEKFRSNVHFEKIPVQRQAIFHQTKDITFSKYTLLKKNEKSDKIQSEIKRFIRNIVKGGSTLVVCSKTIRAVLTGEDRKAMEQESQLEGATVIHFGNLRGLNEYSNYRNVIILGREQPSAVGVENNARALFWNDKESIKFLPFVGEHKPFENKQRPYRLKDKTVKTVSTQVHPDKRVQLLLEQIREHETVQAIDRLRLLRPHKNGQRNVYILSSVPLDLTIDNLFSWTQFQKLLDLLDEAQGVIPLNPKHLMMRCPVSARSKSTAERMKTNLKDLNPLIDTYIREMRLYSIGYRVTNKGKYSEALISEEITEADRDRILSSILGTDDIEVRMPISDN